MTESSQRSDDGSTVPSPPATAQPPIEGQRGPKQLSAADFDECYRQCASGLRVALRMRLKNDLDVEDCLNRVFEKLWLQGDDVAPAARRAWLFVVARNEAALVGRHAARRSIERAGNDELERCGGSESGGIDPSTETSMPLDALLQNEQIEKLRMAGRELSDQQAEILRFRFYDDLTFREIADRLQIPLGTALTRVRAAILKLRKSLDDEG